ncbi:hypothetical protein RRU01S_38_00200 [Agrobacterium rubi TR3 = NBRC 13261]|uniref:Hydrolase n=1 Tax=Agrobacterium rubi TR3 = NBRC 13261 TaxID=1368415 RepID=A0A081D3C0_9HYPH|nr:HAD domain-containing protein [Agrobacterium rubi]MBP1881609.1 hypothetical protein [Agrobacterium rubi]GAK73416.1 hypothetical protein RRU01S_38_00200 [Agrobacterium rubi TR3 = NBRC 13261]
MTSKIIFIDIDGVLFPVKDHVTPGNAVLLAERQSGFLDGLRFKPEAVALVVKLAELSGAKLVLSSNWRRIWGSDADGLMRKLVAEGLPAELWHVDWYLPVLGLKPRKFDEIADWIGDHSPCRALIIDDDPILRGKIQNIGIVVTDEYHGFGFQDYRAACEYFGIEVSA